MKDFIQKCIINSFLGIQDEFQYANVFIEYVTGYNLEPMFLVVKECGVDPLLADGSVCFPISDYIKHFHDKWMRVMINDITDEVEKNLEPTNLEVMLDEMRKKSFDIGKPKYNNKTI